MNYFEQSRYFGPSFTDIKERSQRKTSITLTNADGTYTITRDKIDMDMQTLIEEMIVPVLLAAEYHPDVIGAFITCDYSPTEEESDE